MKFKYILLISNYDGILKSTRFSLNNKHVAEVKNVQKLSKKVHYSENFSAPKALDRSFKR